MGFGGAGGVELSMRSPVCDLRTPLQFTEPKGRPFAPILTTVGTPWAPRRRLGSDPLRVYRLPGPCPRDVNVPDPSLGSRR